jgi:Mrp family chromosome partitioning ATPase
MANHPLPPSDDAVHLAGRLTASLNGNQRIVVFTGTAPAQGVSVVAAEVAIAFANISQERILLLDTNVDSPMLQRRFGVSPTPGLVEVLEGTIDLQRAESKGDGDNLRLLPLGRSDADVIQLLGSESCKKLLQLLRQQYRLVVIDAPPLLQSAQTSLLASQSDGVVAVVASGRSHRANVIELKRVLDGLKVSLVGAVLTSAESEGPGAGGVP